MTTPWAAMDEYDEQLHGTPEQTTPPANRGLAIALTIILVALPVLFFGLVLR